MVDGGRSRRSPRGSPRIWITSFLPAWPTCGSCAAGRPKPAGLQHPGIKLGPGKTFTCMEAVYGVAGAGAAGLPSATICERGLAGLAAMTTRTPLSTPCRPTGLKIFGLRQAVPGSYREDGRGTRAMPDCTGTIIASSSAPCPRRPKAPDARRFPEGFGPIFAGLARLGTLPGLWVNSGGKPEWTFGRNPVVPECDPARRRRASVCLIRPLPRRSRGGPRNALPLGWPGEPDVYRGPRPPDCANGVPATEIRRLGHRRARLDLKQSLA